MEFPRSKHFRILGRILKTGYPYCQPAKADIGVDS